MKTTPTNIRGIDQSEIVIAVSTVLSISAESTSLTVAEVLKIRE
jgi:hypothetical protein